MNVPKPPRAPDLREYDWAADQQLNGYIFDAFCLTVVTDVTIDSFLSLVPTPHIVGECDFESIRDRGMDIFRQRTPGGSQGLIEHRGAVVMFESNGYVGSTPAVMEPASIDRTVVSIYLGLNNGGAIQWYVDGVLRSAFELYDASGREGSHPDELVPLMEAIGGFNLKYDEEADGEWLSLPYMQAAFALSEALTGVRVTLELLRESTYLSLDIPLPD